MARRIGIIGGTGVYKWGDGEPLDLETPYGSVAVEYSRHGARQEFFIPRHGAGHAAPPHQVNYRAQMKALEAAHVEHVFAVFNTGSLVPDVPAGSWLIPDDFIDHTRGRHTTFHDEDAFHADMTQPYCPTIRDALLATAGPLVRRNGVYAAVEGPRLDSAAEARLLRQQGAHVVGMTGVPEVVLARELGLCYAAVCFVANPTPASGSPFLDAGSIQKALARRVPGLRRWIRRAAARLPPKKSCTCARRVQHARLGGIARSRP